MYIEQLYLVAKMDTLKRLNNLLVKYFNENSIFVSLMIGV